MLPKRVQPLAGTLHRSYVILGLSPAHGPGGPHSCPGGLRGPPCQASHRYPPVAGPQAGCSPPPCMPVRTRVLRGSPQGGDGQETFLCLLCLQKAGDWSSPRPPHPPTAPSLIPSLAGPVCAVLQGAPPLGGVSRRTGRELVPSREGGPSGQTPHPGRVQTLDSSLPTDAKPRALSRRKPPQMSKSCFHRWPSTDRS